MTQRRRGWAPPALAVAGLLAAALAAASIGRGEGFGPGGFDLGLDLGPADPLPAGARERGESLTRVEALGEFSFWTVVVIAALLAAPMVVMMIKLVLRAGAAGRGRPAAPPDPGPEPEPEEPAEAAPPQETRREVRRALHAGLAGLDTDDDPRRAVIACWLRLERAAAAAGTPRTAADTPADLVARLLAAHRVGQGALDRLAQAYRRARYSPHEVDDSLREQARRALTRVDAELAAVSGRAPDTAARRTRPTQEDA
ncbi:DUF4129 domain-containing protein [Planobispora siamensis]|uniref:DUF4129 domain-containing protein n=1 Tax=Planobispora siamensis TaxID=936338 RepID=UPI0019526AD7|nr:DUF4129 domain-containing protein [Planobispora siamensis]